MNIYDHAEFEGDINAGESETLTVQTSKARTRFAIAIITDAAGNTAPTYDLAIKYLLGDVDEFDQITGRFKQNRDVRYHERLAVPERMRYTVTNQSGSVETYRIVVLAVGNPF